MRQVSLHGAIKLSMLCRRLGLRGRGAGFRPRPLSDTRSPGNKQSRTKGQGLDGGNGGDGGDGGDGCDGCDGRAAAKEPLGWSRASASPVWKFSGTFLIA